MLIKNRPTFGDRFTVRQTLDWVFDEWKQTVAEGNPNHYNKVWAAIETCANSVADIRGYGESDPSVTTDQPATPDEDESIAFATDYALKAMDAECRKQANAPDEDAAVRELIHAFWIEGGTVHKDIAIAYAKRILAAGFRRPVDTRPTRFQLCEMWPISELNNRNESDEFGRGWASGQDYAIDQLIAAEYAVEDPTPDPAPAAEVPVVEVSLPASVLNLIVKVVEPMTQPQPNGRRTVAQSNAAFIVDTLTAALTKATDR